MIRVGIDTGGTFTDLVAHDDETGAVALAKVPSTPERPVGAVTAALDAAGLDPSAVAHVVVGTTIGINAVLTRTGARVLYLTTKGFEDIPFIQRISRKYHYDYRWRKPVPLVSRRDCIGVEERVDEAGNVLVPLDAEQLAEAIKGLHVDGNRVAIAVCYLFSYLEPAHELATREALDGHGGPAVSLSHEVAPIWREYERGSTVIVDAYLKPLFEDYVAGLEEALSARAIAAPCSLLKSNGGHALGEEARRRPAHLMLSGIAGGAIGGAWFARSAGAEQAIMLDMGGTSCDVCLIVGGEPLYSSDYEIEYGFPVSVPGVATKTIGAGGGSIGWVDPGGFLQVGPQSAGADPGPACYGQGGEEATLTDANLVLGRLNAEFFLGGRLHLRPERAEGALDALGAELGRDPFAVASSMVRIANENMANAIRIVTVEQGIDPRDFALVAMGGAGPTHAAEIADAIGMRRVLVPPSPGLASAFGALAAPLRVDAVRSVHLLDTRVTAAELGGLYANLEGRAALDFAAQSGGRSAGVLRRVAALRYQGQNYEQEVAVPAGELTPEALAAVFEDFARLYEGFYGYRLDGIPIELVRLQVVALGDPPPVGVGAGESRSDGPAEAERSVWFPEAGFVSAAIRRRESLSPGDELAGPLVVEEMDSTIAVPPGWRLGVLADGVLEATRR
jgi:N-methylhydantoinase A